VASGGRDDALREVESGGISAFTGNLMTGSTTHATETVSVQPDDGEREPVAEAPPRRGIEHTRAGIGRPDRP
jgi:hypothetical protein